MALNAHSAPTSAASASFRGDARAKAWLADNVHDEHHGHLALFHEHFHVGVVHARAHVPVDGPDVVARSGTFGPHETPSLALEHGRVAAGELLGREPVRRDLNLAQGFESSLGITDLTCKGWAAVDEGHGTSTTSKTLRTMSSASLLCLWLRTTTRADSGARLGRRFHVFGRDVAAVAQESVRARRQVQRDARARTRAELDERREVFQPRFCGSRVANTMSTM